MIKILILIQMTEYNSRYVDNNTAEELYGYVFVGQGYDCCMELYFIRRNNVEVNVKIESKTNFVKMLGSYRLNNRTRNF